MISNMVIGFIGGGNMGKAMAEGLLKKGLVKSSNIIVSAPSVETLNYWKTLSVHTTHSNAEVVNNADVIIFAFKPDQINTVLGDIKNNVVIPLPSKLFVSVLAGVPSVFIYKLLQQFDPGHTFTGRLIRVMPNTLALIGEGCSGISPHQSATSQDLSVVKEIFTALGQCEIVPESLLSAVTGISGSAPAYIYIIIEALSDGGVKEGLPRNLATNFAAQTVLGAAKMVLQTKKHPGELKDEVCSPGGTTIHAVHALETGGLRATLMNAVGAAAKKANEIANTFRE